MVVLELPIVEFLSPGLNDTKIASRQHPQFLPRHHFRLPANKANKREAHRTHSDGPIAHSFLFPSEPGKIRTQIISSHQGSRETWLRIDIRKMTNLTVFKKFKRYESRFSAKPKTRPLFLRNVRLFSLGNHFDSCSCIRQVRGNEHNLEILISLFLLFLFNGTHNSAPNLCTFWVGCTDRYSVPNTDSTYSATPLRISKTRMQNPVGLAAAVAPPAMWCQHSPCGTPGVSAEGGTATPAMMPAILRQDGTAQEHMAWLGRELMIKSS